MTVLDHPERSRARARGDLAERLVPVASEFAFLVRTEGREAIGTWLDEHGISDEKARALLVVVAAGWPIDATNEDTLEWVTWDETGRPLTVPCGTFKAYRRHKRAGELVDDACQQAARVYWRDREKLRKPAAREEAADAA